MKHDTTSDTIRESHSGDLPVNTLDAPVARTTPSNTVRNDRAQPAWTRDEFEAQLRAKGAGYHIHHPFNVKMNGGGCSHEQIRGWVANRFYYQINIPMKDAAIMSNCPDRETRRRWVLRILDHDGHGDDEGGIETWARLGDAVGLSRDGGPNTIRGSSRPASRISARAFRSRSATSSTVSR